MRRDVAIDVAEKGEELLMATAVLALGEDLAGLDVQGGGERRGAVARVVMGDALHVADSEGQVGLGALEGLNLGLP